MVCPLCFGRHLLAVQGRVVPCPECEGHGEIHCCEGLQEQPTQAPAADAECSNKSLARRAPPDKKTEESTK